MVRLPRRLRWLFWDVAFDRLEVRRDAAFIVPRVLQAGCLADVAWLVRRYGLEHIHRFLRDQGHPELSPRTIAFWRVVLKAKEETWASPPAWRLTSGAPWPG
jgi:hypothetical protein